MTFEFAGYTLRTATTSDDLDLAREWTEADPDHAGRVKPEFWITQGAMAQGYLLSDIEGPLFFFKGVLMPVRVIEVHIQFPPVGRAAGADIAMKKRIANGLIAGEMWLEERMRGAVDEICFESSTPDLVHFCVRWLGFEERDGRLRKSIPSEMTAGR